MAEQNVLNVLADGIAVGKIDEAKVETAIAAVKKASAGVHDAALDSLKQLHDTLTPEQRAALVDKVDAHWEVWKSTNNMDEMPGDADHPGHIDRLAKDVNLAPDQVAKIRATFSDKMKNHPQKFDPTQVEAHLQEFGAAFKAPSFDPKTLPHGAFANQHLAVWGARRMAHFYEAVDPLLTPEQRTKLSGEIKEHAAAKSGVLDGDKHERWRRCGPHPSVPRSSAIHCAIIASEARANQRGPSGLPAVPAVISAVIPGPVVIARVIDPAGPSAVAVVVEIAGLPPRYSGPVRSVTVVPAIAEPEVGDAVVVDRFGRRDVRGVRVDDDFLRRRVRRRDEADAGNDAEWRERLREGEEGPTHGSTVLSCVSVPDCAHQDTTDARRGAASGGTRVGWIRCRFRHMGCRAMGGRAL